MFVQKVPVTASPRSGWRNVVDRLIDLPWLVKGVMFVDLGSCVAFLIVKVIVLCDLHTIKYQKRELARLMILQEEYYDSYKSQFWALCGVALELNLHTSSVVIWGILAYSLIKFDPSWVRAWCRLRKVIIFMMIIPTVTTAFGGGQTYFTHVNIVVFFFYYLEAVLAIEVVSRYDIKEVRAASIATTKSE